ncbi:MAG: hypothetical protein KIT43_05545 [Bauldia sp.]|nr:hypothetical protein [Bauldia sp.]
MRNIIVHIGMEKTGTTTIQRFCAANRDILVGLGVAYPVSVGSDNHRLLATFAMTPPRTDESHVELGLIDPKTREAFNSKLEQDLAIEIAALPDSVHTIVFSNEHCHSRLLEIEDVVRLKKLIDSYGDNIKILVYLRRQDEVATSLYSTGLRAGLTRYPIFPTSQEEPNMFRHFFNYDTFVSLWEEVFGPDSVEVRIFDRDAFPGGSVLNDFLAVCSLPQSTDQGFRQVPNQNESIQPVAQEFLRRMNERIPWLLGDTVNSTRWKLPHLIADAFPGPGRLPLRGAARDFMDQFSSSNEALRARRFPERASLFHEGFERYPEQPVDLNLSFGSAIDVSVKLWEAVVREVEALKRAR